MALELESLRKEIAAYLDESGLAVFHGYPNLADALNRVSWDTAQYPDFKQFLETARKSGAKLIVFHSQAFSLDQIDEALERLEEAEFTREEQRNFEARLRQLQAYEGFTCSLELSFSADGITYVFALNTEWYEALSEIIAELDAAVEEEEGGDAALGNYFSNN
ncbi:MAG: hypothetical protein JO091_09815 [Acidobacteriaceae bacterium]|nr:hypothetical protein [Acidobacteriaceae bacterium]